MAHDVALKCSCGAVRGTAMKVDAARGNRLVCMCDDCQAYVHWLERPELLDGSGGTEIFQLCPAQVRIDEGVEQIRCFRLSDKGLMRWYAACCRTPIGNGLASARVPFLGVPCVFMDFADEAARDEALGPIIARVNARFGRAPLAPGSHARAPLWLMLRWIRQMLRDFVRGAHAPSPVFDDEGAPIVEPTVLSAEARRGLVDLGAG